MDQIDQIIANCRRDSRTVSGSERRALCDEVERLRRELQAATVPTDNPGDMARCTECGRGLLFSCRQLGDGLCHVCGHKAAVRMRAAIEQLAHDHPDTPVTWPHNGRTCYQDIHDWASFVLFGGKEQS